MSNEGYGGSEELTPLEIDQIENLDAKLEDDLVAAVTNGQAVKSFLNTAHGQACRRKIAELEAMAMKEGMENPEESERDLARYRYDVLQSVKSVFAILIAGGEECLNITDIRRNGESNE